MPSQLVASKPVTTQPMRNDFVTTEDGRLLIDEGQLIIVWYGQWWLINCMTRWSMIIVWSMVVDYFIIND